MTRARWPARGCSASATARSEIDELLDGADGDSAEELIAARAAERPAMSAPTPATARPPRSCPRTSSTARCGRAGSRTSSARSALKDQLAVSIAAAASRGEALDHVLLAGPPGLGKTSLAQIVAAELDVPFVQTAGPALERKGDVAAFLTALEPRAGVLRRRDPPPAAGARGDLLPGDGGRLRCRSPSARARARGW